MNVIQYIFFFIIFGIYFILLTLNLKNPEDDVYTRYYNVGVIVFLFCIVFSQLIYLISLNFLIEGSAYFTILYSIGNIFGFGSAVILMYVVEKYVYKELKYVPTITLLSSTICVFFFIQLSNIFLVICSLITLLVPVMYIRVAFAASGRIRTKSVLISIGTVIFFFGIFFNARFLTDSIAILEYLAPILQLIGMGVFIYGYIYYSAIQNKED